MRGRHVGQFLIGLTVGLIPTIWSVHDRARTISQRHIDVADDAQKRALSDNIWGKIRTVARVLVEPLPVPCRSRNRGPPGVRVSPEAPAVLGWIAAMIAVTNLLPTPSSRNIS